jgi:ATP synthase B/B' subunit
MMTFGSNLTRFDVQRPKDWLTIMARLLPAALRYHTPGRNTQQCNISRHGPPRRPSRRHVTSDHGVHLRARILGAVSFFLFICALVYLGVHKKVASALDARALPISKELEEARRLREEAEKVLANYQRKLGDVVTEVDNITALAASPRSPPSKRRR